MITQDDLIQKWQAVNLHGSGYQLVDPQHILEWYVGCVEERKKTMLLISHTHVQELPSSGSIDVVQRQRTDGKWTLSFDLLKPQQEEVFLRLCYDLIEYSRGTSDEISAMRRVSKRYHQWNLLMERQRTALMSENAQKGLIGELSILTNQINQGRNCSESLRGWVGPSGADRDFEYADTWIETKTTGISSQTVTISSVEQLDAPCPGILAIIRIDSCSSETPRAVTLYRAVQQTMELFSESPGDQQLFEARLGQAGYIDSLDYDILFFTPATQEFYNVREDFPRILRHDIPIQVQNAHYTIDIAAIQEWKV